MTKSDIILLAIPNGIFIGFLILTATILIRMERR
jgi:hypothetical protein